MNVFFTGQLYRKNEFFKEYTEIVQVLGHLGHNVLNDTLDTNAEDVLSQTPIQAREYAKIWFGYLRKMDICVAEISFPSTINVGFEVAAILGRGKPVVALFREGTDPVFTSPEFSQRIVKAEYNLE